MSGAEDQHAIRIAVGDAVTFRKTVAESDVYLFAGVTGDFSGNHVDEVFMQKSRFGRRVAHGALLVGFMSTASTLMIERSFAKGGQAMPVALGYDRVRFVAPVFFGDTVNVGYVITEIDEERRRSRARVEVTNQRGEMVAVAEHLLKWMAPEEMAAVPPT